MSKRVSSKVKLIAPIIATNKIKPAIKRNKAKYVYKYSPRLRILDCSKIRLNQL